MILLVITLILLLQQKTTVLGDETKRPSESKGVGPRPRAVRNVNREGSWAVPTILNRCHASLTANVSLFFVQPLAATVFRVYYRLRSTYRRPGFARISRLLAPNSAQANPFQPDSFSVAEVTAYHDIILDLFREFCKAYPAGSVKHRGRVFLYHNLEEVFRSLIWHQVENDKKEKDEEKALNAAQNV
ncbi:hypothetical protein KEM48_009143 [Puccinia striiformis f. sp. tritici PST-130]|nr:hypothetical protein KEM48_009143 [Puccinia striiformis f. sp. tritici PST-130]